MQSLYENYELFLHEHASDITSPSDALKLIADNSMYRSFVDALTEGVDPAIRGSLIKVCDRQRTSLLTEAANVPASAFGFGWTVLSLPILVDIYAEPLIAKICNPYPVDTPVASIPHVRIYSKTNNYDGTSVTEQLMPTARSLVRADQRTIAVTPGEGTNILRTVFPDSYKNFKMNRRYLMVTRLSVTRTSTGGTSSINIPVNFRPDNRAQFLKKFTFLATDGATVEATFQGHVNWDTGNVFWNVVIDDGGGTTDTEFEFTSANFIARFTPVTTMIGRNEVIIKTEMHDVTIDVGDDFLISLTQEQIQD